MALLPRPLRPSWLIRRWAMYRGVGSSSALIRFLSRWFVFRSEFLRRNAIRQGVYGGSRAWQAIAGVFFLNDIAKKATVKEAEKLSLETLKPGQSVVIRTIVPTSKRRKRSA